VAAVLKARGLALARPGLALARPGLALALVAFALAAGQPRAGAQEGAALLRAEFWSDLRPVAGVGDEWPVSAETARSRMLEEAAWVYGGVVWGFSFEYTPSDKARAIAERFSLESLGAPPPGALAFAPGARKGERDESRSIIEYRPPAALSDQMASYAVGPWKSAQGVGKADMILGVKGRRAAYEDALRAALRSCLQGLEPNKPRLVRGRLVFERPPSLALIDGSYTSQARVRVMVVESLPYKVY
jgi:hypothetical protein